MHDEVSQILGRIKALGTKDENFEDLVTEMHRLAALAPVSMGTVAAPGTKLYRGTNHHVNVPSRIEEIWFPPPERIRSFGRANRPGASMFYCCSDPNGAFREIDVKLGTYAVLATWETVERLVVHDVGYSAEVLKRAGAKRPLPEHHAQFDAERLTPETREVRQFLSLAFTDPTTNNYRVTAAIADMLLACDGIGGIMYPTVAKSGDVDNLALFPEFVRSGLKLVEASAVDIDEVTAEGIGGSVIARLFAVKDGNLHWEYTGSRSTDVPPDSAVLMRILPGERKRITTPGQLQINGGTYEMLPGYSIELIENEVVIRDLQARLVAPLD